VVMKKISLFRFICYQDYLKEYFEARKKADPKFSHRYLSRRLGLSSPNFIMMVMQGKRKLTRSMAFKLSHEFNLSKKEAEYLECMVEFTRAISAKEKDEYFSRMMELRKNTDVNKLVEYQYEYYSKWYNLPVRELVTYPAFKGNYSWLAKNVLPPITPGQAKDSVELLLKLGLLKKKDNGFVRSSSLITTGPEVSSVAVSNFHRTMARLGSAAIDVIPKDERDMTSCTMNISHKGFEEIKTAIEECRSRILSIGENDVPADRVYHINFHVFPVTAKDKNPSRSAS
jgi:uncharacterized protein (TIGR02147 family)